MREENHNDFGLRRRSRYNDHLVVVPFGYWAVKELGCDV